MEADEYPVRDDAAAAPQMANGDEKAACAFLSRCIEADGELRQRFVAWGCAIQWWKPTTWGAENGLWELLIRAAIADAARTASAAGDVAPSEVP